MTQYETKEVATTVSEDCRLRIELNTTVDVPGGDRAQIIRDVFPNATEVITSQNMIDYRIGDRVKPGSIKMINTRFVDLVSLDMLENSMFSDSDSPNFGDGDARKIAKGTSSGKILADSDSSNAALVLELNLYDNHNKGAWEDMWSDHILKENSIQALFPEPQLMSSKEINLLSEMESVLISDFLDRFDEFSDDIPLETAHLTCRPSKNTENIFE